MGKYAYKKIGIALAALLPSLALLYSSAHAAGLGRLVVSSALGQPLRGEIEIVAVQPEESDRLQASLATPDAFRSANVELNAALLDVRFNIERRPNGQYAVVLSSTRPVNEPYLDMLVQLETAGGRLIREYTFLLDPPEYKGGAATASAAPAVVAPAVEPVAPQAVAAQPPAPQAAVPAAPPAKASPTYQVKRGDTLSKIARQTAPEGVSLQQMLVALYRANADAFMGNNMNRLRAGRILNIPDRDQSLSVSAQEARRVVNAQGAAYADYQRAIGAAVASAPERPEASRQASGRITAAAPQKPAASEPARDELRLTKPDEQKGKGATAREARGDDAAARNKALRDAQERVAALEKNVADLQKLLALKSAPGAQAQQQAQAAKGAPPAAKAEPARPAKAEPAPAKGAEKSEPAPKAEVAKAEPPKPVAPDAAKAQAKKAPPPPPPEPSLMDELLDNLYMLVAVVLAIVLLVGYAVFAWRRKKQDAAEQRFSPSMLGASSAAPSSVLGAAGGQSVDTGAGSTPMDFSAGTPSKVESEEIDPVAEADVYMAYGRDAQAEEILKEALDKNPDRIPVRLKLLEVYSNRKDAAAFEAAARDLQSATSGQGPDWEKAAAMGRQIDPANPLYGGEGAPAGDGTPAAAVTTAATPNPVMEETMVPPLDFDLELTSASSSAAPDINLDAPPAAATEETVAIDFNLDLGGEKTKPAEKEEFSPDATVVLPKAVKPEARKAEAAAEPAKQEAQAEAPKTEEAAQGSGMSGLDFDLGLSGESAAAPEASKPEEEKPAEAAPAASSGGIDFDFNLDAGTPAAEAPVAAPEVPSATPELVVPELSLEEPKAQEPTPDALKIDELKLEEPRLEEATMALGRGMDLEPTLAIEPPTLSDVPAAAPSPGTTEAPPLDLSAISLDLGDATLVPPPSQGDAKWQEVATKLDLAKAYEEMGDKDGARDLLNEVLKEGDNAQQEQAKGLLATLG